MEVTSSRVSKAAPPTRPHAELPGASRLEARRQLVRGARGLPARPLGAGVSGPLGPRGRHVARKGAGSDQHHDTGSRTAGTSRACGPTSLPSAAPANTATSEPPDLSKLTAQTPWVVWSQGNVERLLAGCSSLLIPHPSGFPKALGLPAGRPPSPAASPDPAAPRPGQGCGVTLPETQFLKVSRFPEGILEDCGHHRGG